MNARHDGSSTSRQTNVLAIGGGYAGVMAANRMTQRDDVAVTLVNARTAFVHRIRLQQLLADSGDAVVDLSSMLRERVRSPGITVGALNMVFVANPLSAIATGPDWLPQPWGDFGRFLPIGAAGTVIRSAAFCEGAGSGRALLVLGAWIVLGLVLLAVSMKGELASAGSTRVARPGHPTLLTHEPVSKG